MLGQFGGCARAAVYEDKERVRPFGRYADFLGTAKALKILAFVGSVPTKYNQSRLSWSEELELENGGGKLRNGKLRKRC